MSTDTSATTDTLAPWLLPAWQHFQQAVASNRLGHGLVIAGAEGLGKRRLVQRMIAHLLDPTAAHSGDAGDAGSDRDQSHGQSRAGQWLAAGSHPDLLILQPLEDSRYVRINQIRALSDWAVLTGHTGGHRVIVIDPAEAMNSAAQNALLKILEEPPPGVHLLLVSDAPARLLPTVRSRCQVYQVLAPARAVVEDWLRASGGTVVAGLLDLAASHPGQISAWAKPERSQRLHTVADDLVALASGRDAALAVASRWATDAAGHVDDAIAWLRVWSWQRAGVALGTVPVPARSALALADASAAALRLRRHLQTPLRPVWLLYEWLAAWQVPAR
ncbi:MAG: hypothetical protein M0Q42_13420 [Xanthomonadales bacterium]|nr:hypothetical protein [Xanthomonadales bacterium]